VRSDGRTFHGRWIISADAKDWIDRLQLLPHPEGGYYRQTYRAELTIDKSALPASFGGSRAVSTAIYFLLDGDNFSAFHRLRSDEMWHFYAGGGLVVHVIGEDGGHWPILLGSDVEAGEAFQALVKAGSWFASQVRDTRSYALVGCTVSPGFDFADFELAKREELVRRYPQHRGVIERLTREG
jgi:predicted cupin superfamily sugar epimerase